jgi:hypothetical protein
MNQFHGRVSKNLFFRETIQFNTERIQAQKRQRKPETEERHPSARRELLLLNLLPKAQTSTVE